MFLSFKKELEEIMDIETDSIRYYMLGNKWEYKVYHVGVKFGYNPSGILII